MRDQPDFNAFLKDACIKLWGTPSKASRKELKWKARDGYGYRSYSFEKRVWYDSEYKCGGGLLQLAAYKLDLPPGTQVKGRVFLRCWEYAYEQGWLPAPPLDKRKNGNGKARGWSPVIARFIYYSASAEPYLRVNKTSDKDFFQERWNGKCWENGKPPGPKILYRLPELLAAASDTTVYLCEGEKDSDIVGRLGLVATTASEGAKAPWAPELTPYFAGRVVHILPDADDPGVAHAEKVALNILPVAKNVKIVTLPGLVHRADHGPDISNWIEAGHTREELEAVAAATPNYNSSKAEQFLQIAQISHAQEAWPEMDPAAFYGLAGDVVGAIEPHSEADPNGILIQFLAAFGNAVGIEPHYLVEGDKHRGKLFVVLCGATSKGRKGTGLSRIRQLMSITDPAWEQNNIRSGLSSGEGLIFHVRDAVSKVGKEGSIAEADPGVLDKRSMLVVEEFAGALRVMERPGNTLSPVLRDAWGTAKLETLTKNSPIKATDSHISLIGHVTDHELRTVLTRTEMANGFANRILFVRVKRSKMLPHGGHLDAEVLRGLAGRVETSLAGARRIGRVRMTDAAARAWEEAYPDLSGERPGLLGAILGRAEAQVIRLALIFALTDGATQIELPHIGAAFAVWSYCEDSAAQIWGDVIGDDVADTILAALKAAGPDGMARTQVSNLFSRHQLSARISTAIALLERLGKAERVASGGHGEQRWRLRSKP